MRNIDCTKTMIYAGRFYLCRQTTTMPYRGVAQFRFPFCQSKRKGKY